jgi:hypothetical protein
MNMEELYTCYDSEEEKDFLESALEDEVVSLEELLR